MEVEYTTGLRYSDGINFDADIIAVHPEVQKRRIDDPVSDGSLGDGYEPSQRNRDGSQI